MIHVPLFSFKLWRYFQPDADSIYLSDLLIVPWYTRPAVSDIVVSSGVDIWPMRMHNTCYSFLHCPVCCVTMLTASPNMHCSWTRQSYNFSLSQGQWNRADLEAVLPSNSEVSQCNIEVIQVYIYFLGGIANLKNKQTQKQVLFLCWCMDFDFWCMWKRDKYLFL